MRYQYVKEEQSCQHTTSVNVSDCVTEYLGMSVTADFWRWQNGIYKEEKHIDISVEVKATCKDISDLFKSL